MNGRLEGPRWNLATRIAFRFAFVYFALNLLPTVLRWLPFTDPLLERYKEFWDAVVVGVKEDVLHLPHEIEFLGVGVSNSTYGWVLFLCYMALSAVATLIWSVLDRERRHYERLHPWLRLVLRYMLAATMISYGTLKVIPSQMLAPPPLGVLQQRIGDLRPNLLMWWTVGASPAFETMTGLAELLGGVLLLVPRTTLLGALISAANMLLVFLLNMFYDVPVKLPSLQWLVIALILIAPDWRRLAGVFLFNRRVEPARVPPLFARKWLDRAPHILLFLFGLYATGSGLEIAAERYERFHPPRPPLYGLWTVEGFALDGRDVPLFTDPDRWRLVQFQTPGSLRVEQMAGSWKSYQLGLDMEKKTMTLGPSQGKLSFEQPEEDLLVLDGTLDGRRMKATLRKVPILRGTT